MKNNKDIVAGKLGGWEAKKKAFTLAEVLITLAIIGVVAALTISSVVAKYQKTQYYTQFMKTYNTLSNALMMASVANGTPDSWGISGNTNADNQILINNLGSYLKISKTCDSEDNLKNCGVTDDNKIYNPEDSEEYGYREFFVDYGSSETERYGNLFFILNDGTLISPYASTWSGSYPAYITFAIDTNGPAKGPNKYGVDIFDGLTFTKLNFQKYQLSAIGLYMGCNDGDKHGFCLVNAQKSGEYDGNYIENWISWCSNKGGIRYCPARLLYKGKMDYDL